MSDLNNEKTEYKKPRFDYVGMTFLIEVKKENVNLEKIKKFAEENNFEEKKEFHITILGFKHGKVLKDFISKLNQESLVDFKKKLEEINNKYNFDFNTKDEFYLIKKDYIFKRDGIESIEHRESIMQIIEMKDLEPYLKDLSELVGFHTGSTFSHITLYTKGNPMGIGINSKEEFENLKPEKL